jgi:hypothetical protein
MEDNIMKRRITDGGQDYAWLMKTITTLRQQRGCFVKDFRWMARTF